MSDYSPNETVYTFSDLVLIARPVSPGKKTVWYLKCTECGERHLINRKRQKSWVANCPTTKAQFTIAPAEYYIMRPVDLSRILAAL